MLDCFDLLSVLACLDHLSRELGVPCLSAFQFHAIALGLLSLRFRFWSVQEVGHGVRPLVLVVEVRRVQQVDTKLNPSLRLFVLRVDEDLAERFELARSESPALFG